MDEYPPFRLEALLLTLNITLTLIVMLGACLCCKRKVPKNDMLGLEGMVKLKNPDEVIVVSSNNAAGNSLVRNSESQAELNASTVSNADSEKRSSTAAHRSLPDIPVAESNDNGSELYETVADKQLLDARNERSQSPQPSLKKQTSISQHSSISQADDVSSPYSRVKGLPHDYAKVRTTEHPYAQLNAPSTSGAAATATGASASNASVVAQHGADGLQRGSQHSEGSAQHINEAPQAEIPAASAIAGMISASQDLPYMTPPIAGQHFSGDSQDSSKGYTSISVREPLANILAQQPGGKPTSRNAALSRNVSDSHYATVSDDSDETYAAIEDPNNRNIPNATDIYTSGSETYAQIQPMQQNPIIVAVEINQSNNMQPSSLMIGKSTAGISTQLMLSHSGGSSTHRPQSSSMEHAGPIPPPVDSLRAQMHSRQASSSSNNSSSVCNLGSPKPEKRQANSPLPPTPKGSSQAHQHHLHATSNSNLTSGRNSVISVIEASAGVEANEAEVVDASPQRKHSKSLSPSKDIEGMYAKVMKKHKLSRNSPSSQSNSPIMSRKQQHHELGISPLDSTAAQLMDAQKISINSERSRVRSNSYSAKDHGYETIPADGHSHHGQPNTNTALHENRKSDCYAANMLQKERQQETASSAQIHTNALLANNSSSHNNHSHNHSKSIGEKHYETIVSPPTRHNDPGYEQLQSPHDDDAKKSEYDPNYEVLKSRDHSDDGYAKVLEKKRAPNLLDSDAVDSSSGYSTILGADANHNYASILETKAAAAAATPASAIVLITGEGEPSAVATAVETETEIDHYARIAETGHHLPPSVVTTPGSATSHLVLTSPTSPNGSSLMHHSSSITTVTTSTSNMSSRQTPISSQYESLTGSETDPNYESVCYLNTTTTNPTTTSSGNSTSAEHAYERLETDTQASSPLTPDALEARQHLNRSGSSSAGGCRMPNEGIVDDYFQV
ncbi:uncharacterized protein LOC115621418 [Scaptodrosophila lebanonensis]|uniref:Uncharacterized protein LOC115621418 n=1 Tax=Drosophila lebanonensis TaxID=7225 RepID=A0A6J2T7L1_DROLE|nr:uncharacterized protein LOC115621418 [Scaptodrosophila lebanonensis]